MGNHCENQRNNTPRGCSGACSTRATMGGNRMVDLGNPRLTDLEASCVVSTESFLVMYESHESTFLRISNRVCGLLTVLFGAIFFSLEDQRLGNTMEGPVLVYGRRKVSNLQLFFIWPQKIQNTKRNTT